MKAVAFLLLMAVAGGAAAQEVRFVACPMFRDADLGRKSGCWLARDLASGITYDVSGAPVLPDWEHGVLVEGRVAEGVDLCGGQVLEPVRVSVLDDMTCLRRILPAEGYTGRRFALPKNVIKPLYALDEPVTGPFSARTFRIYFEYRSTFFTYQSADFYADQAAHWLVAARPRRIVITGYAATGTDVVSGRILREPKALARQRADNMALWLERAGIDPKTIVIKTSGYPRPVMDPVLGNLREPSLRRVEIEARF